MRKKIPVHRTQTVGQEVEENETEWRDHDHGGKERRGGSKDVLDRAPGVPVGRLEVRLHCTARVGEVVIIVLRNNWARRLTRIVTPKRTRPISNKAWR